MSFTIWSESKFVSLPMSERRRINAEVQRVLSELPCRQPESKDPDDLRLKEAFDKTRHVRKATKECAEFAKKHGITGESKTVDLSNATIPSGFILPQSVTTVYLSNATIPTGFVIPRGAKVYR